LHTDITNSIVDQIFGELNYQDAKLKIIKIISSLMKCPLPYSSESISPERKLAGSIALLTVNKFYPTGKKERTEEILSLFPNKSLNGIHFWGTISHMDFTNIIFQDCCFDQVILKNCEFDETTMFKNCTFYGGRQYNCNNLGYSTWESGFLDADATSFINTAKIVAGKRKYNREDLKSDIENLIKKFMPKEGMFKSIVEINLAKGAISSSLHRDDIISAFKKYILEEHHVSGTTEKGYKVNEETRSSFINYVSNKFLSGPLGECFDFLCKKLNI